MDRPIEIKKVIRRMRGGSQAQLVQGEDDLFYVAKFAGNPQGDRTLINEWITSEVFKRLAVSTPNLSVLRLRSDSKAKSELYFQGEGRRVAVQAGLHLGSACPVNPMTTTIFDFLPESLIHRTTNLTDFAKALVLDTLLAKTGSRQAIFTRDSPKSYAFRAHLIDHGMTFGGNAWEFADYSSLGFHHNRKIYSMMDTASVCEEALVSLDAIPWAEIYAIAQELPPAWFAQADYGALTKMFTGIQRRKEHLRELIVKKLEILSLVSQRVRLDGWPKVTDGCRNPPDSGHVLTKDACVVPGS